MVDTAVRHVLDDDLTRLEFLGGLTCGVFDRLLQHHRK
jgi:hypothetical protein